MKAAIFKLSTPTADPSHWVVLYADYLYGYALSRLDDEELSRDLVQETFLAALEKLSEFRRESSERTWLTAILRYKVIEVYRKRNSNWLTLLGAHEAEQEYFEVDNGHWHEAWAPQPMRIDQPDPAIRKELASILQKCLQRLPDLWFAIFSMKHMDDMEAESICKELKVSSSNYWVILHRAKVNLRACIQKEYS
ncbi:MAG TPA: sigma-70 family RNA polymerase sigma factor [Puia sp.]|jgi:RNA polymerase sigma-70 factor (ECF subfamily)